MTEIWRKLYRCLGLIFPILYFFYNREIVLTILLIITLIFIITEILRFKFPIITEKYFKYLSAITKEKERKNLSGTTYVLISSLLTVLFFEKSIAITALLFLILGDSAASLIGQRFGRIKIWDKTFEGSLACFIICFIVGIILLYFGLELNYILILFGALAATITELIPLSIHLPKRIIYIDDNLTIALASGLVMSLVKGI